MGQVQKTEGSQVSLQRVSDTRFQPRSCFVNQSCLTLCDPMDGRTPGFPVLYHLPKFAQTYVCCIDEMMPSSHLILCHPLPLLPSVFPASGSFPMPKVKRNRHKYHLCPPAVELRPHRRKPSEPLARVAGRLPFPRILFCLFISDFSAFILSLL